VEAALLIGLRFTGVAHGAQVLLDDVIQELSDAATGGACRFFEPGFRRR
jgi:hypothetical protein